MNKTLKTIGENTIAVIFLLLIVWWGCGCNVTKRINQAKIDAVTLDHAQNPCSNDTTLITGPGETMIFIDTVINHTRDTLALTPDTLRETITITKYTRDTIMAVVVDKRLINDYKDSVQRYKVITATLQGRYLQQGETLVQSEKRVKNLFFGLFGIALVVCVYIFLRIKSVVP